MKIEDYKQLLNNKIYAGTEIWACAFVHNSKNSLKFSCEPTLGILASSGSECIHEENMKQGYHQPRYFVPYSKTGKLIWSKIVNVSSRKYATTEEESKEMYKGMVEQCIKQCEDELDRLKQHLARCKEQIK